MVGIDDGKEQWELRFRHLYQANFRPVQAYAVNRLGLADDAPDVVAEVFTIAWRRLADVPPAPADRLWLYGTARRVIARRHRSAIRRRNLLGRLAAQRYPTQVAEAHDPVQQRVLAALGELKPAHREALLLVHWEELSYAEAAQALGCSANAVGIRVHKAKTRLRALLDPGHAASEPFPAAIKLNGVTDGS